MTFREYLNESKLDTLEKAHEWYYDNIVALYRKADKLRDGLNSSDWDPKDKKEMESLEDKANKNEKLFAKAAKDLNINIKKWDEILNDWDRSISLEKYNKSIK